MPVHTAKTGYDWNMDFGLKEYKMRSIKYLLVMSLLILGGCDSDSDEQAHIGGFKLQTAVETDFFVLEKELDSREFYYSNSNALHFDKYGYLVNDSGSPLLVFPVDPNGNSTSVSIGTSEPVQINYTTGSPKATDRVSISTNLPQNSGELSVNEFDKNEPLTFNHSTSVSVIDSLGDVHTLTFYFIHVSVDNNTWEFRVALDDNPVQSTIEQVLDFDSSGLMDINDDDLDGFMTTENGLIENINIPLSYANDLNITLDFTSDTTSFNSNFEVTSIDASGFYTGRIKEFKIESNGLITFYYTNGQDKLVGRVALAKFFSPYNLQPLGNSLWAETEDSGIPIYGEAEAANFDSIIPIVHDF